MIQLVAVDGTKIFKIEGFKQYPRCGEDLERFLGSFGKLVNIIADFRQ